MKQNKIGLLSVLLLTAGAVRSQQQVNQLKLWYNAPAKEWYQALPLGNGRLGAMVFGKVSDELIQLNEATLWSGGPVNNNVNPEAAKYLPQVRAALFRENYHQADSLLRKMQGVYSQSFLPMGDLHLRQEVDEGAVKNYYRDLDLTKAQSNTRFTSNGVDYTREMFISAADQVIVYHLKSSKKGQLNFTLSANSQLHSQHVVNGKDLVLKGKAPSHADPNYVDYNKEPIIYEPAGSCNGMRFEVRLRAISVDGTIKTDTSGITVRNATDVTVIVSGATSFNGYDKCPDKDGLNEDKIASEQLAKAAARTLSDLRTRHIKDYTKFFNRVQFTIDGGEAAAALPTDERLRRYTAGDEDPSLESMYFQYGRYLLISCSRTKGAPANLQGIWNKELRAPWSSNYTININTEMNYWPAEECNLMEMQQPLYDLLRELAVTGRYTAKNFYNLNGWVAHHNTDIWATSNPVGDIGKGDPNWANWMMGGNWLCQFLWQHYEYSGSKAFLKDTAYPIMKAAAQFSLGWLVPDKEGHLVTAPATSPENIFITDKGEHGAVSLATTMDMSVIHNLFTNVIAAADVLGKDAAFADSVKQALAKLYPLQVGKKGNLQEWYKDWEDEDPQHRHISHLFGLFPGNQISPITTPELAAACRKSLEIRGDGGTGWSKAWKINTWARLLDGNHAHKLLKELLTLTGESGIQMHHAGGTYANLFCAHPPFQIDGNFGGTSGIAQMLLQSQTGTLHLLPALPDVWNTGKVKGLLAQGGYTVDMDWKGGMLTSVTIHATKNGTCMLRVPQRIKADGTTQLAAVKPKDADHGFVYALQTKAGQSYTLYRVER
ncbi:glycoside hydrolase family 95 protein [Chitinophaga sp.]|uniref:glycoside hydrolase family 95 protein n=1 Tax=Chitinophaga sp. TaxID=1869181 RepID=UPI0031E3ADD7